jgi:integrase
LLATVERARLLTLFATAKKSSGPLPNFSAQAQKILEPLQGIVVPSGAEPSDSPQAPETASTQATAPALPKKAVAASLAGPALFTEVPTLQDLYQRWQRSKKRAKSSEQACLLAIETCDKALGRLPIDQLTRAHGDVFRSWLREQPISPKTARDRFTWVKSLLGYASRELELLSKQPWEGMEIEVSKAQTRRPWRDDELKQLFTQPLFTAYDTPKTKKSGCDAAYWVPIIALYSGAHIGELAQLRTCDISILDGVPMLTITDTGEGQHVKSAAGHRCIPIHPELVRLGLLEYAQALREGGHDKLWPMLSIAPERPGLYLSNWFGEYRRGVGLTEKYPDFHSFRHSVRTRMSRAKILEKVQDAITGHETQGSVGTKVYQSVGLEERLEAIQALAYPSLSLPKVYTAPRMETAERGGFKARVEARRKQQGATGLRSKNLT